MTFSVPRKSSFSFLRLCYAVLLFGVVYVVVTDYRTFKAFFVIREGLTSHFVRERAEEDRARVQQACIHPHLEVNDSFIMSLIEDVGPLTCSGIEDWVHMDGSAARISEEARKRYGEISCNFTDVLRASDHSSYYGKSATSRTEYRLKESDFVVVSCRANESGSEWRSVMAGVRVDGDVVRRSGWHAAPADALRLNVLAWGFDSLSRNMFARKLPRSLRYLRRTLRALELRDYNVLADGTPEALIPILTGRKERELPETRKRMGRRATFVNAYPFVWNDFRANGYVTAFAEDAPHVGCFTYRLKGFAAPPTDHYMRTFYKEFEKVVAKHPAYCVGSTPRHKVMMNYVVDFFKVYREKPKFMFAFHGELSHDSINMIGAADNDFLELLRTLRREGHLNSTLLIVMSDHGHRFTRIRNSPQGKLEQMLPMFSLVFPEWFARTHPNAIANVRENTRRLTTPLDIYPTLRDVLHFSGSCRGSRSDRSISLFKEIPSDRSCADASIEPHWCACLDWQQVNISSRTVKRAADAALRFMNQVSEERREMCSLLRLDSILWAARLLPNRDLRFRRSIDNDGFIPDLSGNSTLFEEVYQLKLLVQPGAALYEVSLTHRLEVDSFLVKESDISRINRYAQYARCVEEDWPHLRKYCHCRELISKKLKI